MKRYELILVGTRNIFLNRYSVEIATGYTIKTKNETNALKCFENERFRHLYDSIGLIYYVDQDFLDFGDSTKHQKARIIRYCIDNEEAAKEDFLESLKKACEREGETYCKEFMFYDTKVMECID